MASTLKTKPKEPAAEPAPPRPPEWGICTGCGRERRLELHSLIMQMHRVWLPALNEMARCPGSGQPVRVTT